MNREFIKDSCYSFVRLFGLLWLSLLIVSLSFNIFLFFFERNQVNLLGTIDASLLFIITFGGCFVIGRTEGYKNNAPFSTSELPKYGVVLMLHVVYAFLFRYAIYTTGAAYDVAHIIWRKTGHDVHGIGSAPFWLYLLFLVAFDCLYFLAVIWGRKSGYKKRIRSRKQLTGK